MSNTALHPSLTLVHSVRDGLAFEKRFHVKGYEKSAILIRVFAAHAGHLAVQAVTNVGRTDRRFKLREGRVLITSQSKQIDLDSAYAALNHFVDQFISCEPIND